jgi:asparaginyl-tRNA synthetase
LIFILSSFSLSCILFRKKYIDRRVLFFLCLVLMKTTSIKSIYQGYESMIWSDILVKWWIRSLRDSKTFWFIEVNDGSYLKNLQVVFNNDLNNFDEICKFTTWSSIEVRGELVKSEWAKQAFEVKAKEVTLIWWADETYPLQKKRH